MFLEMAKDMPRGRQDSLARMLVPVLVVMVIAAGGLGVGMMSDARMTADLRRQIDQQARTAGVLFLDDRLAVPWDGGVLDVPVLMDGRRVDARLAVEDGTATLLVRSTDGTFVPVAPGG